jgi:hypothetical protein
MFQYLSYTFDNWHVNWRVHCVDVPLAPKLETHGDVLVNDYYWYVRLYVHALSNHVL